VASDLLHTSSTHQIRHEECAEPKRLPLLDVLRGVAILGTLATNIWIFTFPGGEWGFLNDPHSMAPLAGEGSSIGEVIEAGFRFLANGKSLALLTILFGVGLAIQYRSAQRHGQSWPGRYPRRAALLFVEGSLHFVLIFGFDVLMGYAVTALLVAWLLSRSQRVQKVVMWTAGGLHLTLMSLLALTLVTAPEEATSGTPQPVNTDQGYLEQVGYRLDNLLVFRLEPIITFGMLVFLFLLGVRLFRAGAFDDDERGRRLRRRMLWWGLGVGLPLNALTTMAGPDLFTVDRYVVPPLVALGLIGLIGTVMDRVRRPGPLTRGLTSVGRTALSCYVTQNLVCLLVCSSFGLGFAVRFADVRPWATLGLWVAVCVTMLGAATLWLRRFSYGPLETAQRWVLAHWPERRRTRTA